MLSIELESLEKPLKILEREVPKPRRNSVVVKIHTTPLLSYTKDYLAGKLPYWYPPFPFSPGTNAVGEIHEVGDGVYSLKKGQLVAVHPNWTSGEGVTHPENILIGLTGITENSQSMLDDCKHGTWREYGEFPSSVIVPLTGLEQIPSEVLASLSKVAVPFGGLRRIGVTAGETVVINGATGNYGVGAALGALALGANVILSGRDTGKLNEIAKRLCPDGTRIRTVTQSQNFDSDIEKLKDSFGSAPQKALCMVGQAQSSYSTNVALNSLTRGGQLVVMGSLSTKLDLDYNHLLLNNWEVKGHFMYTQEDYLHLVSLVRHGLLDLSQIETRCFAPNNIESAIEVARASSSLESIVLKFT